MNRTVLPRRDLAVMLLASLATAACGDDLQELPPEGSSGSESGGPSTSTEGTSQTTAADSSSGGSSSETETVTAATEPTGDASSSSGADASTGSSSDAGSESGTGSSSDGGSSSDTREGSESSSGAPSSETESATSTTSDASATDPTDTDSESSSPTTDTVGSEESSSTGDPAPYCGDGFVDPGEACDDGPSNGDGISACTASCTDNACGDDYLHTPTEECDDGQLNGNGISACRSNCDANTCGDLYLHIPTELCDEGPFSTPTCDDDCTPVLCGDGFINDLAGEQCDDGDLDDTNVCTNACARRVAEIALGPNHTCARGPAGNVRCWGPASLGQLGYGNNVQIGDDELPASAGDVDVGGTVLQLDAGGFATCARLDTGSVRCWGHGGFGQLGYGNIFTIGDNETPDSAGDVDVGEDVVQIAVGANHTCALLDTGFVRCWGYNPNGQLGYGNTTTIGDNESPAFAGDVNVGGPVTQIVAGDTHTCALLSTGNVRCWGWSNAGALGYGNINMIGDNESPASAGDVNVGGTVVQLSAGRSHTCARLDTGAVRCWGSGVSGKLGYGNTNNIGDNEAPSSAGDVPLGGNAIDVVASIWHTCAVLEGGTVRCWGFGGYGALGYADTDDVGDAETPAFVGDVDVGGTAVAIDAGEGHTCVLLDTGRVKCWGWGDGGVCGYGNLTDIGDDEAPSTLGEVVF